MAESHPFTWGCHAGEWEAQLIVPIPQLKDLGFWAHESGAGAQLRLSITPPDAYPCCHYDLAEGFIPTGGATMRSQALQRAAGQWHAERIGWLLSPEGQAQIAQINDDWHNWVEGSDG